jgi:DNA-directed RNA polymerase II subunit RPB2
VLNNPEKPLVTTRGAEVIESSKFPDGVNVIAAIMCAPFNEEDAIELSKSSVDLGLFRDTKVITYKMAIKPDRSEYFGKPDINPDSPEGLQISRKGNFRCVNEIGHAEIGSVVEKGDVLLCKLTSQTDVEEVEIYKEPRPGRVASIMEDKDSDGYLFYRLIVHEVRVPVVGDKFAARHAQKGVCGRLTATEDLPWVGYNGLRPDIIVNALAFPSRMTIAMVIEIVFGIIITNSHILGEYSIDEVWDESFRPKLTKELPKEFREKYMIGDQVDGTPFRKLDLEDLNRELDNIGISMGEQECYDGRTGEPMTTKVMMGPVYYQRLKHLVHEKFHSRATGPVNLQTRQPPEGRGHDGGLKFGVMESDSSNASGNSYLTKDRLMDSSDATDVYACADCGSSAYRAKDRQVSLCQYCSSSKIERIQLPYGTKLMNQELSALNIVPKIIPLK